MRRTNFHTHVARCRHATGDAEDYVQAAIAAGVEVLGFSDHAPFPDVDFGPRMQYSELPDYVQEIHDSAKRHAGEIELHVGLEIEYLPDHIDYYHRLLASEGVEYLILAGHMFRARDGKEYNVFFDIPDTSYFIDYARYMEEAMHSGCFVSLAHPDIIMMQEHFVWDDYCEEGSEIIIRAAEETGLPLEYNANGMRRGIWTFPDIDRYPYPDPRFWSKVATSKALAYVGNDCHNPAYMWDERMVQCYRDLERLGIEPVEDILKQRETL